MVADINARRLTAVEDFKTMSEEDMEDIAAKMTRAEGARFAKAVAQLQDE